MDRMGRRGSREWRGTEFELEEEEEHMAKPRKPNVPRGKHKLKLNCEKSIFVAHPGRLGHPVTKASGDSAGKRDLKVAKLEGELKLILNNA